MQIVSHGGITMGEVVYLFRNFGEHDPEINLLDRLIVQAMSWGELKGAIASCPSVHWRLNHVKTSRGNKVGCVRLIDRHNVGHWLRKCDDAMRLVKQIITYNDWAHVDPCLLHDIESKSLLWTDATVETTVDDAVVLAAPPSVDNHIRVRPSKSFLLGTKPC